MKKIENKFNFALACLMAAVAVACLVVYFLAALLGKGKDPALLAAAFVVAVWAVTDFYDAFHKNRAAVRCQQLQRPDRGILGNGKLERHWLKRTQGKFLRQMADQPHQRIGHPGKQILEPGGFIRLPAHGFLQIIVQRIPYQGAALRIRKAAQRLSRILGRHLL